MNIILLKIESAKYVQEIDLNNETGEVVVKFSCETPLNEMDTCDMFTFYFGEVYYDVSDEDFFIRKGPVSEMGGNMRLAASEKSIGLKVGDVVTIPIISEIEDEIKKGIYNPDKDTSIKKLVERSFGDLFDSNGNLIYK
ncbi:hypothetical protein RI864_002054 [Salmonella enterica]|nr:hypothetical protein [Salmonella enterica]EJR1204860.1 hypothetical protein [Salmonella enterica subsp. enterica serovar Infantis]EAA9598312.1 hypothetical protein [Salmonella enterica]EAO9640013.1 hypothetical protein [Salmonella enterica]ECV0014452.1 hypothetical protein [Salmonella enterica]